MITLIHCEHCGHGFESEVVDKTVECKNCGNRTPVFQEAKPNMTPTVLELVENKLDIIGRAFFSAGIIGTIFCAMGAVPSLIMHDLAGSLFFISLGVLSVAQGWIFLTLFRALAEILRLLRRR